MSRIILDIPPQPHYEIVDGARIRVLVQTPDFFQNLLARDDLPIVAHQMTQQFRLHQRETNCAVLRAQFESAKIDRPAREGKCSKVAYIATIAWQFFGPRGL